MTESNNIPEKNNSTAAAIKIPIFLGINNKEKLDQVIEILKDDDVYEIAIISPVKYRDLVMEYQYAKMTKEQQDNVQKLLKDEEAIEKTHKLMLDLSEAGYQTINRDEFKQFMRMHRGRSLTNKEADEILDVMYAMKKIELLNPNAKQYEYKFRLLVQDSDRLKALEIKNSAIKEQIQTLSKEADNNDNIIDELKERIETQEQIKNDISTNNSTVSPNTESEPNFPK